MLNGQSMERAQKFRSPTESTGHAPLAKRDWCIREFTNVVVTFLMESGAATQNTRLFLQGSVLVFIFKYDK